MWILIHVSYKSASAHVKYKSISSKSFKICQGVGQGRFMSVWFFSLFINGLINLLVGSKNGLLTENLLIPYILSADDTTLLSFSNKELQDSLNIVHKYAKKWRLKYNALKSNVLVFTSKRNTHKFSSDFQFGDVTIDMIDEVTNAGTIVHCRARTFDRTENACKN